MRIFRWFIAMHTQHNTTKLRTSASQLVSSKGILKGQEKLKKCLVMNQL